MGYNFGQPQTGGYMPANSQPQAQSQMMNQNVQPLFPQPQGNVYNINSTLEVANVPVGAGISVALCLAENTMFIKTMQNGNPMFYPYKILPFANEVEQVSQTEPTKENTQAEEFTNQLKNCIERISAIEEMIQVKKKGVEFNI